MTDEQILELGFQALVDKLGPVGMVVFIHFSTQLTFHLQ